MAKGECQEPASFIDEKGQEPLQLDWDGVLDLDIRSLTLAVSNPLMLYIRKKLGIYLYDVEDEKLQTDKECILSPLMKAVLSRGVLSASAEDLLSDVHDQHLLPEGIFGKVARDELSEKCSEIIETIHSFGLEGEQVFTVEFSVGQEEPVKISDSHQLFPAIEISIDERRTVRLYGTIDHVTSKGRIAFGRRSLPDIAKLWPSTLALCKAKQTLTDVYLFKDRKLFRLDGIDPENELRQLVHLYFHRLQFPSLALPEWMEEIRDGDQSKLEKKIEKEIASPFLFNDALQWSFIERGRAPEASDLDCSRICCGERIP